MDTPSTSTTALKLEIERLTGVINQRKTGGPPARTTYPTASTYPRPNVYVNPNYKLPSRTFRPPVPATVPKPKPVSQPPVSTTQEPRDVIIGGVAFESSGRSLVRKDLPKPTPKPPSTSSAGPSAAPHPGFTRNKAGTFMSGPRPYKPKTSRRGRPMNRNMTLNNTQRPYQRRLNPRRKYSDKACPRFSTTGTCTRGLTCFYQHDSDKVAICWPFLQDKCPNTAETCPLSHDPIPERTPLCVHFANNGRCNRPNCPFPHVRVGQREVICRDFAVLGYCEKGLDCDKQHVRECPDFAEKGSCTTLGCKLPHVIRANRNRKAVAPPSSAPSSGPAVGSSSGMVPLVVPEAAAGSDSASSSRRVTAEDAQLGDEFISLTFHESESEEDDSEEDEEDEEDDDDGEEGQGPPGEADVDDQ